MPSPDLVDPLLRRAPGAALVLSDHLRELGWRVSIDGSRARLAARSLLAARCWEGAPLAARLVTCDLMLLMCSAYEAAHGASTTPRRWLERALRERLAGRAPAPTPGRWAERLANTGWLRGAPRQPSTAAARVAALLDRVTGPSPWDGLPEPGPPPIELLRHVASSGLANQLLQPGPAIRRIVSRMIAHPPADAGRPRPLVPGGSRAQASSARGRLPASSQ